MNPKKEAFRRAFIASVPILCSYLFLGMAYGILMQEAGFGWAASLLTSAVVYTGAFQFVLITFLSSGASILTIAVTALFMNSRQSFYALTFLNDFKAMGKRRPYMIHSLTDETYAVNCTLESLPPAERRRDGCSISPCSSHFYWTAASALGGMLGQIIPFDMTGIDFCMTALFVTIFVDQWEKSRKHMPALAGLSVAIVALAVFGANGFMLPALLITSAILVFAGQQEGAQ
ncbi:MAG: AzlC family ABC transporter permease [Oscillospiraceae bacterium]